MSNIITLFQDFFVPYLVAVSKPKRYFFSMTKYFAILNITPDSFSDGGKYIKTEDALRQAEHLMAQGADFLDVGGESTRPGAETILPSEEWKRVESVLKVLLEKYPKRISLDTRNPETAQRFLEIGGTILNDVSGFQDPKMRELAAQYQPLCIINHFPGRSIEEVHTHQIDSVQRIKEDLLKRREALVSAGVLPSNIILDPGIGFGKTMACNARLLEFAREVPEEKVLIGHSRKRFLGENRFDPDVNQKAAEKAIQAGAAYLRVHEVNGSSN